MQQHLHTPVIERRLAVWQTAASQNKKSDRQMSEALACMSDPADDVAAMTKPATANPAITPPAELPAHTANTKMATCNVHVII